MIARWPSIARQMAASCHNDKIEAAISLIRRICDSNLADLLPQIAAIIDLGIEETSGRLLQHVDTLAFRLESSAKYGAAAQVHELSIGLADDDETTARRGNAFDARLRDLCARGRFVDGSAILAALSDERDPGVAARSLDTLLSLAWLSELRGEGEAAVGCYCLALETAGDGASIRTRDGQPLRKKIKDLRRLQLDELVERGAFDAAIMLHDSTRRLINAGRLIAYEVLSVKAAADRGDAQYWELKPARRIEAPQLKFLEPPPPLTSTPGDLSIPPFYLAFIERARAFPRSNVVIKGSALVYDLAAHPRRDDVLIQDGVNPDQIMMAAFGMQRALVEVPDDPLRIDAGLCLFGLQSRNYGHWFCEFVPRLLAYNHPRCPSDMPLCIDDHMPRSHQEIVALLDERDRPVVKLPPVPVEFGTLGLAPVPAFFPFEMKPGRPVYDTIWPADILIEVRSRLLARAQDKGLITKQARRRLLISRKSFQQRQLINEAEIAEVMRPLGFEIIYPEALTFLEQVAAFHSAEIVVGSSSSALTNGLFCRPGTQILGLIHEELSFNFRGYTSFIEASGAQLTFVRGRTVRADGAHAFHASYTVSPALVLAGLDEFGLEAVSSRIASSLAPRPYR